MMERMTGFVVSVNPEKGYGYLQPNRKGHPKLPFPLRGLVVAVNDTVSFFKQENEKGVFADDLIVLDRNRVKYSTEDKQKWCRDATKVEFRFVEELVPLTGRHIDIHPEKKKGNRYHIDLIDLDNNRPADLKQQNTPFFTASRVHTRYDPTYTVTFNKKDYENYRSNYPQADIYFWVEWEAQRNYGAEVQTLKGVWVSPFAAMAGLIERGEVSLHAYQHRVNDNINAKESYLFDLRNPIFTRLLDLA